MKLGLKIFFLFLTSITIILAADLILKLPFEQGEDFIITQGYNGSTHQNKDFYALDLSENGCEAYGKFALAVSGGRVISVKDENQSGGYGYMVDLDHGNNLISRYAHLIANSIIVKMGDEVKIGQPLGKIGNTGNVSPAPTNQNPCAGTHLHFAMYQKQSDGTLVAYKPEPISGYSNLLAGMTLQSDNLLVQNNTPGLFSFITGAISFIGSIFNPPAPEEPVLVTTPVEKNLPVEKISTSTKSVSEPKSIPALSPPAVEIITTSQVVQTVNNNIPLPGAGGSAEILTPAPIPISISVSTSTSASTTVVTSTQEVATTTEEISPLDVVINEVAWADPNSKWIELYNRTSKAINLSDWVLYSQDNFNLWINLGGTIAPRDYYLLGGINNLSTSGEVLVLSHASTTIDQTALLPNGAWPGGTSDGRTMERFDFDSSGADINNWGTNNLVIGNGSGTPASRNSLNYLIARGAPYIYDDLTLKKENSPYLVNNQIQFFLASSTLTIEPGVVIKFFGDAGFNFNQDAKILAQGTSTDPITFTGFDNQYWYGVDVFSAGSVFDYTIFQNGGKYYNGGAGSRADLDIENFPAAITNSVFETANVYGLKLINSDSFVANNIFRNNIAAGIYVEGGNPLIQENNFSGNNDGLYSAGYSGTISQNNFTNNAEAIFSSGIPANFINNSGSGNNNNAIALWGGDIALPNSTTTLQENSLPYVLKNSGNVASGSSLVIEPGVTIKMPFFGQLNVSGNLYLLGDKSSDILFTAASDNAGRGWWSGINFYPGSYSQIRGATIEDADKALTYNESPINLSNILFSQNNFGIFSKNDSLVPQDIEAATIEFLNNFATTSPSLW